MSEPPTWPPPPETPHPMAVHDDFLVDCICTSKPNPPLSRLRLTEKLHQKTGQDLRFCRAVVNDFCDRHTILMPLAGFRAWLPFLFWGLCPVITLAMNITRYFLGSRLAKAVLHSQKVALSNERIHLDAMFLGLLFANLVLMLIAFLARYKKTRADAAEAVAKFAR